MADDSGDWGDYFDFFRFAYSKYMKKRGIILGEEEKEERIRTKFREWLDRQRSSFQRFRSSEIVVEEPGDKVGVEGGLGPSDGPSTSGREGTLSNHTSYTRNAKGGRKDFFMGEAASQNAILARKRGELDHAKRFLGVRDGGVQDELLREYVSCQPGMANYKVKTEDEWVDWLKEFNSDLHKWGIKGVMTMPSLNPHRELVVWKGPETEVKLVHLVDLLLATRILVY